jgi:glycerate kinase
MRILVAPDSFKGSLGAPEAAAAMARGIRSVFPEAEVIPFPVADGGEGTTRTLVAATGGRLVRAMATGPLGTPVEACWGVLGDGVTAVLETASASGLTQVPPGAADPLRATTRGTGELLKAALDQGHRRILLGLGGSATTDGGAGLLEALGVRFLDADGQPLPPGGGSLVRLAAIDASALDPRLAETTLQVACDVDNPLCGLRGAAAVFGPQKGAGPDQVAALDAALATFARVARATTGRDPALLPGAGAAGGLGAGLLAFTNARLHPGIALVLETCGFQRHLPGVDWILTGEGRTDAQTAAGKAPLGVARAAAPHGIPVLCLSGSLGPGAEALLDQGLSALMAVPPGPMDLETCMAQAASLVEEAAARLCRLLAVGRLLRT